MVTTRPFWYGGRNGYYPEWGEWTPSTSWSYTAPSIPGLTLRVAGKPRGLRVHPIAFTLTYDLGGAVWRHTERVNSVASARRRSRSIIERELATAWRTAWTRERLTHVLRWDATATAWEPFCTTPYSHLRPDGTGTYAYVRAGEPVWYLRVEFWGHTGSTVVPEHVTPVDVRLSRAVARPGPSASG